MKRHHVFLILGVALGIFIASPLDEMLLGGAGFAIYRGVKKRNAAKRSNVNI